LRAVAGMTSQVHASYNATILSVQPRFYDVVQSRFFEGGGFDSGKVLSLPRSV